MVATGRQANSSSNKWPKAGELPTLRSSEAADVNRGAPVASERATRAHQKSAPKEHCSLKANSIDDQRVRADKLESADAAEQRPTRDEQRGENSALAVAGGAEPSVITTSGAGAYQSLQSKVGGRGRGLLQALLGERANSWLDQRTVILDIRNGKPKKQKAGGELKLAKQVLPRDQQGKPIANEIRIDSQPVERSQHISVDNNHKQSFQTEPTNRRPILLSKQNSGLTDKRVPTFGSVPQRLTQVPYYSYHGQAKNVNLTSSRVAQPQDKRQAFLTSTSATNRKTWNSTSTASSTSVSSSSQSSGQIRRISSTPLSLSPANTFNGDFSPPIRVKNPRNYSNISNIFAAKQIKPTTEVRQSAGEQAKSASQLNLSGQKHKSATQRAAGNGSPMNRRRNSLANLASQTKTTATKSEQLYSKSRSSQSIGGGGGGGTQRDSHKHQQQQPMYTSASTSRASRLATPLPGGSALGGARRSNLTVGQAATLQRRPVSSAAHYAARSPSFARSAQARPYSRFSDSPYGPPLTPVDPDCPVHGDEVPQRRVGRSRFGRGGDSPAARPSGRRPLEHAVSHPELLYEMGAGDESDVAQELYADEEEQQQGEYEEEEEDYQQLNSYQQQQRYDLEPEQLYATRRPMYGSPTSPSQAAGLASKRPGSRQQSEQQAYYNSASKFSLYHPTSEGVQPSLAPTSEQLRRILGYRPQPANTKPVHLHPQWAYSRPFIHLQPVGARWSSAEQQQQRRRRSSTSPPPPPQLGYDDQDERSEASQTLDGPRFWPFNRLQDAQAIRAVDFHPNGQVYAIGSNSRALRICAYPAEHELRHFNPFQASSGGVGGRANAEQHLEEPLEKLEASPKGAKPPRVLFKFLQLHRGSIYCVAFNPSGQLLATGSNDQTVHLVKYNSITHSPDGDEFRLTMHNGTVRDLCFIDDSFGSGSSLLLSAGGGDNKIYVTDCDTITPYQSMAGHTNMVMGLNHCGGAQFVSGSHDKTIRFWDLRTRTCTSIVSAPPSGGGVGAGAPVSALRVDPSGRLLVSGHTDSTCMLYDIRGGKIIQTFRQHDDEIRAISFSPKSYYLLTGSYDGRLVISDLQGDLTRALPSACVAQCQDKIVQAEWHPSDFTFVSTSADKSATLWALPGELM